MADKKEKALPTPPKGPFSKKRSFGEQHDEEPLIADRMMMAMAQGKGKDFMKDNMPDSDAAKKLAELMMGMTGMMPPEGQTDKTSDSKKPPEEKTGTAEKPDGPPAPPEEVYAAAEAGDVQSLMGILKQEYRRRHGIEPGSTGMEDGKDSQEDAIESKKAASIEKEVLEDLFRIASENDLSLDWLFFRALKKYVSEYKSTGNL